MNKLMKLGALMTIALMFGYCDDAEQEGDRPILNIENVQDGAEGGTSVQFALSLVNGAGESAIASADISMTVALSGSVTEDDIEGDLERSMIISSGQSTGSLVIEVVDDSSIEDVEELIATVSNVSGADLGIVTASAYISDNDDISGVELNVSDDISVLIDQFYHTENMTITFDEDWVTINTTNQPDHKSMYYSTDHALYEAYDEPDNDDFKKNPGEIVAQDITFKIPRNPSEATNKSATTGGPIGVAINSVVFFNQAAAPGDDIFDELNTFDQYEGHPAGESYHYHLEPVWLTTHKSDADNEAFIGFLMDGFPIYGPYENGEAIVNDDLDVYHGHVSVTPDFPNGIYHYHANQDYPWINGDGYFGEKGTRTN